MLILRIFCPELIVPKTGLRRSTDRLKFCFNQIQVSTSHVVIQSQHLYYHLYFGSMCYELYMLCQIITLLIRNSHCTGDVSGSFVFITDVIRTGADVIITSTKDFHVCLLWCICVCLNEQFLFLWQVLGSKSSCMRNWTGRFRLGPLMERYQDSICWRLERSLERKLRTVIIRNLICSCT